MPIARKVKVAHCSVNLYQLDVYSDARYCIYETAFGKLDGKEFSKREKYGYASQIFGVKLRKKINRLASEIINVTRKHLLLLMN